MKILDTLTINNVTISLEDKIDIGNDITMTIKELFEIEDEPFVSIVVSGHPNMIKINKTDEVYESCRFISSAKKWVAENIDLLQPK